MANKGGYGIARKSNIGSRTLHTNTPATRVMKQAVKTGQVKGRQRQLTVEPYRTGGYTFNETTGQRRRNTK